MNTSVETVHDRVGENYGIFKFLLMSILTGKARDGADKKYRVFKEDDGWHGIEYVNNPTPSGCVKWVATYSDRRGWPDKGTAIAKIKEMVGA